MTTVEDLFSLGKRELNDVYQTLSSSKKSQEASLLDEKTKADEDLEVKLQIVKHIFNQKMLSEL